MHYYQRQLPYDSASGSTDSGCASADKHTYAEPKFMVTIVSGSSGDREDDSKCPGSLSLPAVECSQNYGCELSLTTRRCSAQHASCVLVRLLAPLRARLRKSDPLPPPPSLPQTVSSPP